MTQHDGWTILLEHCTRRAFLARAAKLGASASALGALLAACGGNGSAAPSVGIVTQPPATAMPSMTMSLSTASSAPVASPVSGTTQVMIQNFAFTPQALRVPLGAEVTWINADDVPHTVTAQDKQYTSAALDTNDRYVHTFSAPGVYVYYCAIHPIMTGQIIVQ